MHFSFFKGTGIFVSNLLFALAFFVFSVFLILQNELFCAVMGFIWLLFAILGAIATWNQTGEELSKIWWTNDPLFWVWNLYPGDKWKLIRSLTLLHIPFFAVVLIAWCCHIPDCPPVPPQIFLKDLTPVEQIINTLWVKTNGILGDAIYAKKYRQNEDWNNNALKYYNMCFDYEKWKFVPHPGSTVQQT